VLEDLDRFLNGFQVEARSFLDDRQAVVADVLQMAHNQGAHHFAMKRLLGDLEKEAFHVVAGADTGRIQLLDAGQGLLELGHREGAV